MRMRMSNQATMPGSTERGLRAGGAVPDGPLPEGSTTTVKNPGKSNFQAEHEALTQEIPLRRRFRICTYADRKSDQNFQLQTETKKRWGWQRDHRPPLLTAVTGGACGGVTAYPNPQQPQTPKTPLLNCEWLIKKRCLIVTRTTKIIIRLLISPENSR